MMLSLLLQSRIVSEGAALAANIFWSNKANIPTDDGIYHVIKETGGPESWGIHNDAPGPGYNRPSAQILSIGSDPEATYNASYALLEAVRVRNTVIDGVWVTEITPFPSTPFEMPLDANGRARYAFNVRTMLQP